MQDITVQPFHLGLLDECVELYEKTYSRAPWNESWESKNIIAGFMKNHYANNYFRGFVAMQGNRVAGVSLGFLKPWINGMEYYIDEFFVDIEHHRQGIGSKLMSEIKKSLLAEDIHAIILSTERGYPAQSFYESLGFTVEETAIILEVSF